MWPHDRIYFVLDYDFKYYYLGYFYCNKAFMDFYLDLGFVYRCL
ncbi:hypothetical protein F383_28684 [Gossypium arboreum]|uniref:Uncharacterized protein n=1 Tax=Gossypium arboreum TaxID=29729 RepID=A0A0B0PCS2_GOSAR|nr:hypothetical protein F383_28684 [Gossypium arboreum]